MFGPKLWFIVTLTVCLGSNDVYAVFNAEERAAMVKAVEPFVKECRKEFNLTLDQSKETNDIDTYEHKYCLKSCIFKKTEVLDENGMFVVEKALEFVKSITKNEKTLEHAEKVIKECSSVNEEEVSDGTEGCERTKLLLKCYKEHRHKGRKSS